MALASSPIPNYPSTNSTVQISHASVPSKEKAEEPLESELREELRKELKLSWYDCRKIEFARGLVHSWTSGTDLYMLSIDSLAVSTLPVYYSQLLRFCNKPTVLYWAHTAQLNNVCPRFIWGCIYKEWFRCYGQAPRLDFEYFFANPVCIKSTGPSTILELLETHKCFHNRAALLLDNARSNPPYMEAWPDRYKILPVCRAIIVVLDELVRECDKEDAVYLDLEVQRQNVVMVRTGDEAGLSEPVSFESVKDLALPLARPDIEKNSDIDAIRVPLATAVQFMVNLQRREEIAIPESAPGTAVDPKLCPFTHKTELYEDKITNVDDWVDRVMERVDEMGIENVRVAQEAMETIQAARRGETPDEPDSYYFRSWR